MSENESERPKIKLRYETLSALHAAQVILNTTPEEVLLDFSSGVVPDPGTGEPCIPIHTRVALSRSSATRLRDLLNRAIGDSEPKQANVSIKA